MSAETRALIVRRYVGGEGVYGIYRDLKLAESVVRDVLDAAGVPRRTMAQQARLSWERNAAPPFVSAAERSLRAEALDAVAVATPALDGGVRPDLGVWPAGAIFEDAIVPPEVGRLPPRPMPYSGASCGLAAAAIDDPA